MPDYPPPLDRLLRLDEPGASDRWRDYRELGLGPEHVPDLIRMATDATLVEEADYEDPEAQLESWAPQHALRALGQLGAVEAAGPLLEGLDRLGDIHDFWVEDLAEVMARLGPETIDACERFLAEPSHDEYNRGTAAHCLEQIGQQHPEHRERCVAILTRQLERHGEIPDGLAGFLIAYLIDLEAVESAATIEAAFEADAVDPMIAGDWPDVRYALGLGPEPERKRRPPSFLISDPVPDRNRPSFSTKKKQQKAARKKQRKRKRGR